MALTHHDDRAPSYDELPELLTIDEWRRAARLGRAAAYACVARGDVRAVRFGRAIRIPKSTLVAAQSLVQPTERSADQRQR